jgi:alpha-galactosidase
MHMKKNAKTYVLIIIVLLIPLFILLSCTPYDSVVRVEGKNIRIEFDENLHSRVTALFGKSIRLGEYMPSEYVAVGGNTIEDFQYVEHRSEVLTDEIGSGKRYTIVGQGLSLTKEITVSLYNEYPALAVYNVRYTNTGETALTVNSWTNNRYSINNTTPAEYGNSFWSYQSESTSRRADWVLPVNEGFNQRNYMGMNNSDYGGGTPVSNVWRPDVGIAVGHVETTAKLVSIPVSMPNGNAALLAVAYEQERTLEPGSSLSTFDTFVTVHQGDYFGTLVQYRDFMIRRGIPIKLEQPSDAYESQWCAWGYERNFTMEQVYGTLPMVKELGYHWAVLDDGWQNNVGDWQLDRQKYPQGDGDMQRFVQHIHDQGLRSKLWWAPLAVHPSARIYRTHPEYLLLNKDGKPIDISWWNSYYFCPAYKPVQEYTRDQVITFMKTWGYQGLKIDGQHLNGAPPCYNPAHNHERPEESVEAMADFFKVIYETALDIVPDALIEICPCGTAYSFFNMPYMTQGVASDPTSSWQVRHKGRTLKALMGTSTPYFGDHVELTSSGEDFASQIGIGAVIGTKFTWPVGAKPGSSAELTPEREKKWAKWSEIYAKTRLPEGTYLGELYDIGFYRPETHAIKKDERMYYAFYADQNPGRSSSKPTLWKGSVELRGLENKTYTIIDYVNNIELAAVKGPVANLNVEFTDHLLVEAIPH